MDLIANLNSLGMDVNAKYRSINYGGCAVYAAIVGKELQALGVEVKVLVGGGWSSNPAVSVDEARKNVKKIGRKTDWHENNISFGHVGLEFFWKRRKYHYDSNGAHKPQKTLDGSTIHKGRMTLEECTAIAAEPQGWNTSFNRRQIPALRRMIKAHFAEMKAQM